MGYGSPLQGGCLEGFDFLGLHHICVVNFDDEVLPLKQREDSLNLSRRTKLALEALMAMHGSCKPENTVRFCTRAPSFRIHTANSIQTIGRWFESIIASDGAISSSGRAFVKNVSC